MDERREPSRDLGGFIRAQRGQARLSLRRLSALAGISNPYLSQIERGLRHPSAEILQQIAKALHISAETLYVRAGILEERPAGDLAFHIRMDPVLSDDQKDELVRVYEVFLGAHHQAGAPAEPGAEAGHPAAGDD